METSDDDGYKPDPHDLQMLEQMLEFVITDPVWKQNLRDHIMDMVREAYRAGDENARDKDSRDESDTYEGLFR